MNRQTNKQLFYSLTKHWNELFPVPYFMFMIRGLEKKEDVCNWWAVSLHQLILLWLTILKNVFFYETILEITEGIDFESIQLETHKNYSAFQTLTLNIYNDNYYYYYYQNLLIIIN